MERTKWSLIFLAVCLMLVVSITRTAFAQGRGSEVIVGEDVSDWESNVPPLNPCAGIFSIQGGGQLIQNDKEAAIQFWMKRRKVPREAAILAYEKYAPTFKLTTSLGPVQNQWQFGAKRLNIDNPPPIESIVDFHLLQEVLRE